MFGEYRAQTGVDGQSLDLGAAHAERLRARVEAFAAARGRRPRLVVGKPGLDGHSNGAEQIAVRARDAGFEVVYDGIRLTPGQIAAAAVAEDVHCVGLSILSGSHGELVPEVLRLLREGGGADIPVVVGGVIPQSDADQLRSLGVAAVFTPKDYDATEIIDQIVDVIRARTDLTT
jgi:(2R)-ethylmalonyl-CoA mutase